VTAVPDAGIAAALADVRGRRRPSVIEQAAIDSHRVLWIATPGIWKTSRFALPGVRQTRRGRHAAIHGLEYALSVALLEEHVVAAIAARLAGSGNASAAVVERTVRAARARRLLVAPGSITLLQRIAVTAQRALLARRWVAAQIGRDAQISAHALNVLRSELVAAEPDVGIVGAFRLA